MDKKKRTMLYGHRNDDVDETVKRGGGAAWRHDFCILCAKNI